jgi:hypothetical protein
VIWICQNSAFFGEQCGNARPVTDEVDTVAGYDQRFFDHVRHRSREIYIASTGAEAINRFLNRGTSWLGDYDSRQRKV